MPIDTKSTSTHPLPFSSDRLRAWGRPEKSSKKPDGPSWEFTNAEPVTMSFELLFDGYTKEGESNQFARAENETPQAASDLSKVDSDILRMVISNLKA